VKQYIIEAISKFSEESDRLESSRKFIDKHWMHITSSAGHEKFIFKKGGELLISRKGNVQIGTWELLKGSNSMLIKSESINMLLNHRILIDAMLILQIDGRDDEFFVLMDENLIPDLSIKSFLKNEINHKGIPFHGKLINGDRITIYKKTGSADFVGNKFYVNDVLSLDGLYFSQSGKIYSVKDGSIEVVGFV